MTCKLMGYQEETEELQQKLDKVIAENKKMREALEFYDQAHRQNWAIDLNKLKTTAWDCLKELKEGE